MSRSRRLLSPTVIAPARNSALRLSAVLHRSPLIHAPAAASRATSRFAVDASWPKPLPNNWILGQVGGITVDKDGHIWVIHRPRSLTDDEKGAALNPPALEVLRLGAAGAGVRRRRQSARAPGAAPARAMSGSAASTASRSIERGLRLGRRQSDNDNADPEVHRRRQVRDADRQDRAEPRAATTRPSLGKPAEIAIDEGRQRDLRRRRLRQPPRHRVRRDHRRLQAPLGRLRQQPPNDDKQAAYDPKAPAVRSSSATPSIA